MRSVNRRAFFAAASSTPTPATRQPSVWATPTAPPAPHPPAGAAADVEVATAASPRRAVPPEATRQHAPAPSRERAGTRVPHRGVAEARGEPPAGGPDARGRALERDARGRLLVARVVIGVAVS